MPLLSQNSQKKANFHAKGRQVRQKLPVWVCITTGLRSETGLRDASLLSLLFPPLSGVTDILSLRDRWGCYLPLLFRRLPDRHHFCHICRFWHDILLAILPAGKLSLQKYMPKAFWVGLLSYHGLPPVVIHVRPAGWRVGKLSLRMRSLKAMCCDVVRCVEQRRNKPAELSDAEVG